MRKPLLVLTVEVFEDLLKAGNVIIEAGQFSSNQTLKVILRANCFKTFCIPFSLSLQVTLIENYYNVYDH